MLGLYISLFVDFNSPSKENKHILIMKTLNAMEAAAMPPPPLGKSATKITALVVDDDTTNQIIHHMLLKNLGINNQVVMNGKEAVDAHSSGQIFDLILMDMDMPVMNGIEATRKLRAMGISSLIAGLSSRSAEEVQEFIEAGLDDYQQKPLTTAKLLSILHKLS